MTFFVCLFISSLVLAQDITELKLKDWKPKSMLVTKETKVDKPKFPVIDVHNHLRFVPDVEKCIEEMDAAGVQTVVNLDGGWGTTLTAQLKKYDEAYPGRFLTYALIDFEGIDEAGWSETAAQKLEESFQAGAKGLKIHKTLGLGIRYQDGTLMKVDDPKLDPLWALCGEYNRPVEIHVSDPAAFFTPLDENNERWHELNLHPNWLFYGDEFPEREEILEQRNRVIAKHKDTTFICAHMGNNPEDLATVAEWLDTYPNMYVDIDARISELGRQPYTARKFFIQYQDRVLFGTDTRPNRLAYRMYYRFLESDDEYFDQTEAHHQQGFWPIYGVFLPDDVLEKVYNGNAKKLLFGLE